MLGCQVVPGRGTWCLVGTLKEVVYAWYSTSKACQQASVGCQVSPSGGSDSCYECAAASHARWFSALMPCYKPVAAFRLESGAITFAERGRGSPLSLPCGRCIGCRLERSYQWALRCMHEAQMHSASCFVTLTYDESEVPPGYTLRYEDWQLFMRKLRKRFSKPRFFMCGEYGDLNCRPHFHGCLFGVWFPDQQSWRRSPSGAELYVSPMLTELWGRGHASVGALTVESAGYVARYSLKKVTGDAAEEHYTRMDPRTGLVYAVEPEFCHMSSRPGIGATWFERYGRDVFPQDKIVSVGGNHSKVPRYYFKLLQRFSALAAEEVKCGREVAAMSYDPNESSSSRLAQKETVAIAGLKFKQRGKV